MALGLTEIMIIMLSHYAWKIPNGANGLPIIDIVTNEVALVKFDEIQLDSNFSTLSPLDTLPNQTKGDANLLQLTITQAIIDPINTTKGDIEIVTSSTVATISATTLQPFSDYEFDITTTTEAPPIHHRKLQVNGFQPVYLPTRKEFSNWASRASKLFKGSGRLYMAANKRRRRRRQRLTKRTAI